MRSLILQCPYLISAGSCHTSVISPAGRQELLPCTAGADHCKRHPGAEFPKLLPFHFYIQVMLRAKRRAVCLVTPLCKTKNNSGKINTSSQGTLLPLLVFSLRQGLINLPQLLRAVDLDACESLIKLSFSRARCIMGRKVARKSKTSASSKLCTSKDPRVARSKCHGADPDETTDELDDALDVVDGKESVYHSQPPSPILAVAASISRPSRECISRITHGLSVAVFGAHVAPSQETRTGIPWEALHH